MINFENIMSVTQIKKNLGNILKDMTAQDETITIIKKGRAVGVIMTPERYDAMIETMEILSHKEILSNLQSSREDFQKGRVYSHDEVWQEI